MSGKGPASKNPAKVGSQGDAPTVGYTGQATSTLGLRDSVVGLLVKAQVIPLVPDAFPLPVINLADQSSPRSVSSVSALGILGKEPDKWASSTGNFVSPVTRSMPCDREAHGNSILPIDSTPPEEMPTKVASSNKGSVRKIPTRVGALGDVSTVGTIKDISKMELCDQAPGFLGKSREVPLSLADQCSPKGGIECLCYRDFG